MIVREFYETRFDGINLNRTYSDANVYIRKVGTEEEYAEAIDVEGAPYTYEETDKPIEAAPDAMRAEDEKLPTTSALKTGI